MAFVEVLDLGSILLGARVNVGYFSQINDSPGLLGKVAQLRAAA